LTLVKVIYFLGVTDFYYILADIPWSWR